ncbi:Os10g0432525 [Oryza sativa Japonica Group]|uniref:Os10g0432525 protein n=1 Tax=Oryza sativa subsp. japonica TaxID=39947 RepID=A0A0N7KRU1_ORYSJ|nr:Os10g0432525 [Oryza sativa Japonica Group]
MDIGWQAAASCPVHPGFFTDTMTIDAPGGVDDKLLLSIRHDDGGMDVATARHGTGRTARCDSAWVAAVQVDRYAGGSSASILK